MSEEIRRKITLIDDRLKGLERGSVMHSQWLQMRKELDSMLVDGSSLKIHETPEVCESCQ